MLLPVFQGHNYSYSLDTKSGEFYLYENSHKAHTFLKGKDARIFRRQIEHFDSLPEPQFKTGLLAENLIKILVSEPFPKLG